MLKRLLCRSTSFSEVYEVLESDIKLCHEVANQDVTEVLRKVLDYLKSAQTSLKTACSLQEVTCMTIHHPVTNLDRGRMRNERLSR
jgi:hypothetical protein